MLKKGQRLQEKEDFERVFRQGKPLFFGEVGCKILPNKLGHIRLGFSLSLKHVGTVVARNRLRRVLSEPFSRAATLRKDPSVDIVFFTAKKIVSSQIKTFASPAENVVEYINT